MLNKNLEKVKKYLADNFTEIDAIAISHNEITITFKDSSVISLYADVAELVLVESENRGGK